MLAKMGPGVNNFTEDSIEVSVVSFSGTPLPDAFINFLLKGYTIQNLEISGKRQIPIN